MVSCELSPKRLLGIYIFWGICDRDTFSMSHLLLLMCTHNVSDCSYFRGPFLWILWFRKICNIVILWSASEMSIWISIFAFVTSILTWIKRWTELYYVLCCLKHFLIGWENPQWVHFDWSKFSLFADLMKKVKQTKPCWSRVM